MMQAKKKRGKRRKSKSVTPFILRTKLMPPVLKKNVILRSRLTSLLKENLDKKIILVVADAGYGKTTLCTQFVKQLQVPCIWFQADTSDQDLSTFMRYIIEGLRNYIPSFGKRTLTVINQSRGQEIKLEVLMGTFINELLDIADQKIVFLFDDLQEVYKSKKIISGFEFLLNHIPPNILIIISSRSKPPFALERFHLKNETLNLDQQNLKFNKDEIELLCKQIGGYIPKQVELNKLSTDSGGWITCLQFLVRPTKQKLVFSKRKKPLVDRLYDYFNQEVFLHLENGLKFFLTTTSVIDYLSPEACDFLLSRNDSAKILKDLEKRHLFIAMYDTPQPLYGYHHLFRNFLVNELKKMERYQEFHNRAGLYSEKKNFFLAALQHYSETKNYTSLARLIEKSGEDYMTVDKFEFIRPYIKQLPETVINKNPILIRQKGTLFFWDCNWDEAKAYYERAKRLAQRQKSYHEVLKTIHTQQSMKLNLGEHKGVIKQVRRLLRSKRLMNRKLRARFLNNLGIAFTFERKIKQAIIAFEETLKISRKLHDDAQVNISLHNLATAHSDIGNFSSARNYLEALIKKLRPEPSPLLMATLHNLGALLKDQGNLRESQSAAEEGLRYAKLFNDRNMECMNYINLGLNKIYCGELEQAETLLRNAEKLALEIGHNFRLSHIWNSLAELAINRGNFLQAKHYNSKALGLSIPAMFKAELLMTQAQVELFLKNFNIAEKILKQTKSSLKESKYLLMMWYLQLARLSILKENGFQAKFFINKSIALAEKFSYDFLFMYALKQCPEIIRFIKNTGMRSYYLQHILLKLPHSETIDTSVEPDVHDYDFVVRLFDKIQIFKKGKEIKAGSWRTKRFQEIFSYFITNPGRGLTREKITYTFWPDHNPASAKQLFYNALYWIRKTTAKKIILFNKGSYTLSSHYRYWIDTKEFETLINKGDRLTRNGNRAAGMIHYEKAASLYRGGFMDDFYSDWCQQKRRYFEGLNLYVLRKLAQGHYNIGNFEKALLFCKILISKDPYYENAHCLTMRCYATLNDLGGLQKCFAQLKKVLIKGLNTTPRSETIKLYETLVKQRKA